MYTWGTTSIDRMKGLYPYLRECADRTLEDLSNMSDGFDLTVPWLGGGRTAEEQNDCFKRGASKCDGYEVLSYHQKEASTTGFYMALDLLPVVPKGVDPYKETRKLNLIGRLMLINWQELILEYAEEDIGVMIWGGTFGASSWDRPHFEIRL